MGAMHGTGVPSRKYLAPLAWLPGGWARDVAFTIDDRGSFGPVTPESKSAGATRIDGVISFHSANPSPVRTFWSKKSSAASSFMRLSKDGKQQLVCACNFSPVPRPGYRIGLPRAGRWRELVNTDSELYGGSGVGNLGGVTAEEKPWHDQPCSAEVTLPPLGVVWLVPEG